MVATARHWMSISDAGMAFRTYEACTDGFGNCKAGMHYVWVWKTLTMATTALAKYSHGGAWP